MAAQEIDPRIYELYDEYCHSEMPRREFLKRAAAIVVASGSGLAMAQALLPQYANAQTISFTDERIKARYVTYPSPGGNAPEMRGYLVQPAGAGPFPSVIVIHENRGLNPYIEDVARRAAVEGFIALAPDALTAAGGYPGNDDDGKVMQKQLDGEKIFVDMLTSANFVKGHEKSNGKLGATGFCFGGGVTNRLAVELGEDLKAAAPFYGRAPDIAGVGRIKAKLVIHYADDDPRVNATRADYEAALKAAGAEFEMHSYPGTKHGFHNNSTPRYDEAAAKLAWERTIALFKETLS
ncbi:MAG: dienelactone hydrolase family protein [Alphaproteobacteria bacterium]|nr:dienelactone hydrolase family protein [Alphaproteobacteria bacterium]